MKRAKIIVLASTFPRWDGDTDPPFILHLCSGLQAYYDVHVLAPHCVGSAESESVGGISVHRYRYAPLSWQVLAYDGGMLRKMKKNPLYFFLLPSFLFSQWLALRRLHRQHAFSLVHAHWIIPQGIVAALSPVRFVLTSHGGDLYALDGFVMRSLKRWVLGRAAGVTVVSRAMLEQCERLGVLAGKAQVRSMGVDTRNRFVAAVPGESHERSGILCVGRLVEKKGIVFLVRAMELLERDGIHEPLTIIGEGPERGRLEQAIAESGLEHRVTLLGAIRNDGLPEYYRKARMFVLPSIVSRDGDQEGLGLVSVEAMASGCPVIASDLPAVRDVITHDLDGILVAPASPVALANAVRALLLDVDLRVRLAAAALEKAQIFDWDVVCRDYAKILGNTIDEHS